MIEADAGHHLEVARQLDLILQVSRAQIGGQMIVRIGRTLPEDSRRVDGRVGVRNQDRRGRVVEKTGVSKVVGELPAGLGSGQQRVADAPRRNRINEIGLIEKIPPLRGVVVSRERHLGLIRADDAGHEVLVAPVVVSNRRAIANRQTAHLDAPPSSCPHSRWRGHCCSSGSPK